jgi:predicted solute-binding protein
MLRIGCVKYLNARPLINGWDGDVEFDHPSVLCNKLAAAELDVALVSSFEFLRNPIYRIVDDVSIASDGRVYSVVVAHLGDITRIEEIELDPASTTSVNLLRCLIAELGLNVRLFQRNTEPGFAAGVADHRGRLLIGDQAIGFRRHHGKEFCFWDLGEYWKKSFGLPFVYALWLIRPEVADAKRIAGHLRNLRNENLANLDHLIRQTVSPCADSGRQNYLSPQFLSRYYREHLRFGFGSEEKKGLQTFADLCVHHALLRKAERLVNVV